ncbi:MAG: segregation/condensation protein A [Gammaproteobacteria bacterium]|nr:segregation/condensation protein A [Gammaproteobacteria bacterium]
MTIDTTIQITEAPSFARVLGKSLLELPQDLYIPPDALEVFLETFEGPLDLLLYLIKKQNLEILDISIAKITTQYMEYVDLMVGLRLELAAEYLVMAATLAEIKSRMLLPRPESINEEDDPRAELIRRLQEYERFKKVGEELEFMPRLERDIFIAQVELPELDSERPLPDVDLRELMLALQDVLRRADMRADHEVRRDLLSVRERMTQIIERLHNHQFLKFEELFTIEEGRAGVVVAFIAILELLKGSIIEIVQTEPFAPIHIRSASHEL